MGFHFLPYSSPGSRLACYFPTHTFCFSQTTIPQTQWLILKLYQSLLHLVLLFLFWREKVEDCSPTPSHPPGLIEPTSSSKPLPNLWPLTDLPSLHCCNVSSYATALPVERLLQSPGDLSLHPWKPLRGPSLLCLCIPNNA